MSTARPLDPVVVVGNGPVGQTLALLLARWGIPSLVLDERAERERVGSRAICQHRDVLDVWESVGAGRAIADEGVTWSTARTFYRDRELFHLDLPDPGFSPFPPFVNLSQSRTEEILAERMDACALIEQRWSHQVTAIEQGPTRARVSIHGPEGPFELSAPWVLLAAGARGRALREALGVGFPGTSYEDRFLICDIRADLPGWRRERRFYFDPAWNPGRQVLIHPCPHGVFRIDWQVPEDFDLVSERRSGGLERRIRAILGDRIDYQLVWHSLYRFQGRCATRFRVGRVLLVGDCAHLFSPFGARGLNSGVHDAENAAWKVAFVMKGWAPERLLDSYDRERRSAALENLEVTEATMRFLVPQNEVDRSRRIEILEGALADPGLHSAVDSGRLFEPFWYVDSPLTTPDPQRPFPGRPERGANPPNVPGVILPDLPVRHPVTGDRVSLRSLARDGLLLLCHDSVDTVAIEDELRGPSRPASLTVLSMEALSADEELAATLGAGPGEVWLIRPDCHLAAIAPAAAPGSLLEAIGRLHGVL